MTTEPGDRAVFVEGYQVERAGVIVEVWSDEQRMSHSRCMCGAENTTDDPAELIEDWCDHVDTAHLRLVECPDCRDGCDVYECCVYSLRPGGVVSWDHLCERHREHQGFHDCHPGCCTTCTGTGRVVRATPNTGETP